MAAILDLQYARGLLLCAAAGATDVIDGYLARRFDSRSRAGAYLDPLADKFLLVAVYVALFETGAAPRWMALLVLGRDALILLMAAFALAFTSIRDFPPSRWGKISTTVQVCSALVFMAARAWPGSSLEWLLPPAIWLTAATTAWSGVDYAVSGRRRLGRHAPTAHV